MSRPRAIALALLEVLAVMALYLAAASVLTWPTLQHVDQIIGGGGELGGWMWRYWWHFMEVEALGASDDLGVFEKIKTFLSLGRYPETGNILDILLISFPLQTFLGLPAHYNVKVFLILVLDGLCGYTLGRHLSSSRWAALAAGLLAVLNPLMVQDLYGSGLRQLILWWVLLFPVLLDRAERLERPGAGLVAGACLGLAGAFYWFYGLFAGMFLGLWALNLLWRRRGYINWLRLARWAIPLGLGTVGVAGLFASAYALGGDGQAAALPELTFFLPYPEYDVVRDVPLRPATYEENVLSSLNRAIVSSWAVDYLFDPTYFRSLSLAVLFGGLLPSLLLRPLPGSRARFWAVVFLIFFAGTLGPFLKLGGLEHTTSEVLVLGEEWVIRMPYAWMFRWIPGMSRMFAPYRLGAFVVVGAVALLAVGLPRLAAATRRPGLALPALAICALVGTLAQMTYRFELGPIEEGSIAPKMWRAPVKVSVMHVPEFYREEIDPETFSGIIEMPLEQQQDLLYFYQVTHKQKVYKSWATRPAIPPVFRDGGGGASGARMRYLAREDRFGGNTGDLLMGLSRDPDAVDLEAEFDLDAFTQLIVANNYRHLILHERGYYLADPWKGPGYYRDVRRRLELALGVTPREVVEHRWRDYPGNEYTVPDGPVYIPWASQEVNRPDQEMPNRYFMAIFDLTPLIEAYDGPPLDSDEGGGAASSGGGSAQGDGPSHQEIEHSVGPTHEAIEHKVVPPPGAGDAAEGP